MIRTLFIIAGAALVLCVVTIGGSLAIGGHDLQRHGWAWTFNNDDGENIRIERVRKGEEADPGPYTTRTLSWTGGETLETETGIDVQYVQGAAASVVITGPKKLADRIRLENGRISMADSQGRSETIVLDWNNGNLNARSDRDELKVVVTAPNVRRFVLNGSGDLKVTAYDQPSLSVAVSGSGDFAAEGRTDRAEVDISGSGDVDLRRTTITDAAIDVSGSGDADLDPTGDVRIDISGSGDVTLSSRPAKVNSTVTGSGAYRQD